MDEKRKLIEEELRKLGINTIDELNEANHIPCLAISVTMQSSTRAIIVPVELIAVRAMANRPKMNLMA